MDAFGFGFPWDQSIKVVTQQEKIHHTEKGVIHIVNHAERSLIEKLGIDEGIHIFHPAPVEKELLAKFAGNMESNVIIAYLEEPPKIVGYIVIHKPDERIRWGRARIPSVREMEVIEVSSNYRNLGIAKRLLQVAYSDQWVEKFIIISTEYAWHWDLETSGLSKEEYRKMLRALFSAVGFEELETDEPNICLDPSNMFMTRFGKQVPYDDERRFRALLILHPKEEKGPIVQSNHKFFYEEK